MNENLKRLFIQSLRYKWWMLLAALLGFLTAGSAIGLMMTSAYIISAAALHPSVAELQVAIVGVRFFGLSRAVFRYLERLVTHSVTLRLLAQFRIWFFTALAPLVPPQLAFLRSGDLLSRVTADVETLQNFYIRVLAPPLVSVLVTGFMAALYGVFAIKLGLIVFAFMFLATLAVPVLTAWMTHRIGGRRVDLESQIAILALDGVQGLADLTVFGRAKDHFKRLAQLHDEFIALTKKQKQIVALQESLVGVLMNAAVVAVFMTAAPYVEKGLVQGVYLAVVVLGVMAAFEVFLPLPGAVMHLREIVCAAKRLAEITDMQPPPIRDVMGAMMPVYDWDGPPKPDIGFADVTFSYGRSEPPLLQNFSLIIPPQGRVILTGPSGSGKSTLIKLLLRFHEVGQGTVYVQGRPGMQYDSDFMATRVSAAPQQLFFFSTSIRENMLLAKAEAAPADVIRVCEMVGVHETIAALPEGYETRMGEWGVQFSGGELRRLAIARALLADKPIFIFDEPIANLDAEQEERIWEVLAGLPRHKTVLVISHRLPKQGMEKWQVYRMEELQHYGKPEDSEKILSKKNL